MFTYKNFTFVPAANRITINHEGGLFGSLLLTQVDWADMSIINPEDSKQVLRLLWDSSRPENLETVSALDLLDIQDGLTANIWSYVRDGEIQAGAAKASKYTVFRSESDKVTRVVNESGDQVLFNEKAPLGRSDVPLWAIGAVGCRTCDNPPKLVTIGIVSHTLKATGDDLTAQIKGFWDAILSDHTEHRQGPLSNLLDGILPPNITKGITERMAQRLHEHYVSRLMVGELSADVEVCDETDSPINAVAKIYLDGELAIDMGAKSMTALGLDHFFAGEIEDDGIALTKGIWRELAEYLISIPSFKIEEITPERFHRGFMLALIGRAAMDESEQDPGFGFSVKQWRCIRNSVRALSIPEGTDVWVPVLLKSFYLHSYLAVNEIIHLAEHELAAQFKDEDVSEAYAKRLKAAVVDIIKSW